MGIDGVVAAPAEGSYELKNPTHRIGCTAGCVSPLTLPETKPASSPLKIGLKWENVPDRFPTIHFQGRTCWLRFREGN